jgi:hypothetical protein
MADRPPLKITLTPEQQAQIKQTTGQEVKRLKLEPLESRLAPKLSAN